MGRESEKISRFIVMDEVLGLADKSPAIASFITVTYNQEDVCTNIDKHQLKIKEHDK